MASRDLITPIVTPDDDLPSSSPDSGRKQTASKDRRSQFAAGLADAGARLNQWGVDTDMRIAASLKHGGRAKKTGLYRLHRGERITGRGRN